MFICLAGIRQHVDDGGRSALLHAAAALVLERGNTAVLVAGTRVLINDLAVANKVVLKSIEHVGGSVKDLLVLATVEQDALRAKHLGHLGKHRRAATGDDHIAHATDRGVGGNARKAVGAAALKSNNQLGGRNGLALGLLGEVCQLGQNLVALDLLVGYILAGEKTNALVIEVTELVEHLLVCAVLATERQEQHAGRIRVTRERHQQTTGLGMVGAGLRATERMREVVDALQRAIDQILGLLAHGTGDFVDTADRGDDPQLITRRGTTVGAAEPHKGLGLNRIHDRMRGVVGVLDLARKVGLHIVRVEPLTGLDIARHVSDRKAVLNDVLAGGNRAHSHLVALRNILRGHDLAHPGNRDGGALGKRRQRDDHVVGRIDLDSVHCKWS